MPTIASIQVGRSHFFDAQDETEKPWTSAIIKQPVDGEVRVGELGLDGDEQVDKKHHGGIDKAVLTYSATHYETWRDEFPAIPWGPGAFGENLTLAGLIETQVCVGDVFAAGDCLLQISQPREPCWKLSRRWQIPKLAVRVQQTRQTGWYWRVLRGGTLTAGTEITLQDRLHPEFTIALANDIMFAKPRDRAADRRLAACPALSGTWQESLSRRSE